MAPANSIHDFDPAMLAKAETLTEALPYLQRYAGKTFVVKYGGHAMGDPELARDFAEDVVLLKAVGINPVVVHGGGPQIGAMLKKLGVESSFVDGLRVTDRETAKIAEMVLSGSINKELVGWIAQAGGKALGISGKDAGLVTARKVTRTTKDPDSAIEQALDLGFVGEPATIDTTILETASAAGMIPVIAPIGAGCGAAVPADRRGGGARQIGRAADRSYPGKDRRVAGRWDDFGRDDPQAGNLRPRGRGRVRGGGGARRAGAARDAAGDLHQPGRGHTDPGLRLCALLARPRPARQRALFNGKASALCFSP